MTDAVWDAFVDLATALGPVVEKRSRYADKPALVLDRREIAHAEAPGIIDLRISAAAWRTHRAAWHEDPAVSADPSRRDWIELRVASPADVRRLQPLLEASIRANGG